MLFNGFVCAPESLTDATAAPVSSNDIGASDFFAIHVRIAAAQSVKVKRVYDVTTTLPPLCVASMGKNGGIELAMTRNVEAAIAVRKKEDRMDERCGR